MNNKYYDTENDAYNSNDVANRDAENIDYEGGGNEVMSCSSVKRWSADETSSSTMSGKDNENVIDIGGNNLRASIDNNCGKQRITDGSSNHQTTMTKTMKKKKTLISSSSIQDYNHANKEDEQDLVILPPPPLWIVFGNAVTDAHHNRKYSKMYGTKNDNALKNVEQTNETSSCDNSIRQLQCDDDDPNKLLVTAQHEEQNEMLKYPYQSSQDNNSRSQLRQERDPKNSINAASTSPSLIPNQKQIQMLCETLPVAARELLENAVSKTSYYTRSIYHDSTPNNPYNPLSFHRNNSDLGCAGGYRNPHHSYKYSVVKHEQEKDNESKEDDDFVDIKNDGSWELDLVHDLPPFSCLPWTDRQLVSEWRTINEEGVECETLRDAALKLRSLNHAMVRKRRQRQLEVKNKQKIDQDRNQKGRQYQRRTVGSIRWKASNNDELGSEYDVKSEIDEHDDDDDDYCDISNDNDYEIARTLIPSPYPAPQFQNADYCQSTYPNVCPIIFGNTTNLRHHCRSCGRSFCNAHCSSRHRLPHFGYNPQIPERVCEICKEQLELRDLMERATWKVCRVRDFIAGNLTPYFVTNVDTYEDRAVRLTKLTLSSIKRVPLLGAQATIAVETLEVLRKYGLTGLYGLILRKEFMAAAELLMKVAGINNQNWPISVHELTAAIFYALAQHRAQRGMDPEREARLHAAIDEEDTEEEGKGHDDNDKEIDDNADKAHHQQYALRIGVKDLPCEVSSEEATSLKAQKSITSVFCSNPHDIDDAVEIHDYQSNNNTNTNTKTAITTEIYNKLDENDSFDPMAESVIQSLEMAQNSTATIDNIHHLSSQEQSQRHDRTRGISREEELYEETIHGIKKCSSSSTGEEYSNQANQEIRHIITSLPSQQILILPSSDENDDTGNKVIDVNNINNRIGRSQQGTEIIQHATHKESSAFFNSEGYNQQQQHHDVLLTTRQQQIPEEEDSEYQDNTQVLPLTASTGINENLSNPTSISASVLNDYCSRKVELTNSIIKTSTNHDKITDTFAEPVSPSGIEIACSIPSSMPLTPSSNYQELSLPSHNNSSVERNGPVKSIPTTSSNNNANNVNASSFPPFNQKEAQNTSLKAVCTKVSDGTLSALLFYAPLAVSFIYSENEVDMQLLAAQQNWSLLYAQLMQHPHQHDSNASVTTDRPAFALFLHNVEKIACFVIRGTVTVNDVVTDIRALPVPFPEEEDVDNDDNEVTSMRKRHRCKKNRQNEADDEDHNWTAIQNTQGLATCGMARAALYLFRENIEALMSLVEKGYRIRITGHSLGGGVASLLGALVRRHLDKLDKVRKNYHTDGDVDVSKNAEDLPLHNNAAEKKYLPENLGKDSDLLQVYGYGTPACVNAKLADSLAPFVTTVVMHDDVIPRLTPTSIRCLIKHLLYIRETWVKAHLQRDILAVANRAGMLWAPRWRGGFTLLKKDKKRSKKKKCGVNSAIPQQKDDSMTMSFEGKHRKNYHDTSKTNTNWLDEMRNSNVAGENIDEDQNLVYESKTIVSDDDGHDSFRSTSSSGFIEGDFFHEAEENLVESDSSIQTSNKKDCQNNLTFGDNDVDNDWVPFDEPPLGIPSVSDCSTSAYATSYSEDKNNELQQSTTLSTDSNKVKKPDVQNDASPAVILDELPLPRMFNPGKIVHIYTHRGGYKAAFVPRSFRELRRISLAGNMLADHMSVSYYEGLLEVRSVRMAKEKLPPWMGFGDSVVCSCCASRFTWNSTSDSKAQEARDKYNCRACGDLVCDPCSRNKKALPRFGIDVSVRVCDRCYHDMGGLNTGEDINLPI